MTLIHIYQDRAMERDIVIKDADGNTITPGVNDLVRVTIDREGQAAQFTLTSGTPSANGSTITTGATNTLKILALDLNFAAGIYTMTVDYYDNADGQWKLVEKQVLSLEGV